MSDLLRSLLTNHAKTQPILQTSVLSAAGWDSKIRDTIVSAGPLTYGYVWDQPSNWTWSCALNRDGFSLLSKKASEESLAIVDAIRHGVGSAISKAAAGDPPSEWESDLCLLLAAYAGTTKVWQVADRLKDGGHFVVLNYRRAGSNHSLLRPFIRPSMDNQILPAEELADRIHQVVDLDLRRHPEWFND